MRGIKDFSKILPYSLNFFEDYRVTNPAIMDTTDVKIKGKFVVEGYFDAYFAIGF